MKKFKFFLSMLLCLTMLLSALPMSVIAIADKTKSSFAGGDGTAENPYKVSTPEQLDAVRMNLSAHYVQINDINMERFGNWNPIGRDLSGKSPALNDDGTYNSSGFSGTYNGNGYMISNLEIYDESVTPNLDQYGLFASLLEEGSISNINLNSINYYINKSTTDYDAIMEEEGYLISPCVGGLVGSASSSSISNCIISGNITVNNCDTEIYVGGITGCGGNITGSTNKANINVATRHVVCGGLSGETSGIESSVNYGAIDVKAISGLDCGGILGRNNDTVVRCINYGDIMCLVTNGISRGIPGGNTHVGGIVGFAWETVEYCINYANISSTTMFDELGYFGYNVVRSFVGGIAGYSISGFDYRSDWGSELHNNINLGRKIESHRESSNNDGSVIPSNGGRIAGYLPSDSSNTECYSVDYTLLNGQIPSDYISSTSINGLTLSEKEINEIITSWDNHEIIEDDVIDNTKIEYGSDRFSFGADITGFVGDVIDSLVVYTSANENIASLDITSSNTDVVEIGTIEIGIGEYITTSENEHIATIPLKLKAEGMSTITITSPEGVSESIIVTVSKKPEAKKSIAIFTTEKSLSVNTGDSMWLAFGLLDESSGLIDDDWKKMAVVVSDPTIVSLSEYEKTEYGYALNIVGKKEGSTNVTISDTTNGISTSIVISVYDKYIKSYSYSMHEVNEFYPDNKLEYNIKTNIYNLNGLYVNNYCCTPIYNSTGTSVGNVGETPKEFQVTFDVYNSRYYNGAVDIYDADGVWIGSEYIDRYSDITSIRDTGEQLFYLISDVITGEIFTYEQASFSKKTSINIKVPNGGYFTISNNMSESPGTFFVNAFEILYDTTSDLIDFATSKSTDKTAFDKFYKEATKSFAQNVIDARNESLSGEAKKMAMEVALNSLKSEIEKIQKKFIKSESTDFVINGTEMYSDISTLAENVLNSYSVNWKHLYQSATGVGESMFIKFSGPAGVALKSMFAITKASNKLLMAAQMSRSLVNTYATFYSSIDEGSINPHGIVINTNGNIDSEAVLQVFKVSDNDAFDVVLNSDNPLEKYELYNICFVKDDKLVQPNGKVKVHIPIPNGMDGNTCKIYRQETDGSWTILDAHIEENYLVFETDHFSLYSVVGDMAMLSIASLPDKIIYRKGDILDTSGLTLSIADTVINQGFICEPTVLSEIGIQVITVKYGCIYSEFTVNVIDSIGYNISGTITCFGNSEDNTTIRLLQGTTEIDKLITTSGKYQFDVASGEYTLEVSKANHATRTYEITVGDEDITQDVTIYLLGDLNGDGVVTLKDILISRKYVAGVASLTDEELSRGDINGDGVITLKDVLIMRKMVAGVL